MATREPLAPRHRAAWWVVAAWCSLALVVGGGLAAASGLG